MNAASSSLGRIIVRLARRQGIQVVGIVRRQEAVEPLCKLGAEHVLVSTSENFLASFHALAHQHSATVLFDAVAGEQTGNLLKAMPDRSLAIVYGQMSQQEETGFAIFDPDDLVFRQKRIDGYWLTTELHGFNGIFTPLLRAKTISNLYQRGILELGAIYRVPLEDLARLAQEGVRDHKVVYVRETD
jgi:NADPH:quinone reductase-like Zn-dependent oxidoreductase